MITVPGWALVVLVVFTIVAFIRWVFLTIAVERLTARLLEVEQRSFELEEELIAHYRKEIA